MTTLAENPQGKNMTPSPTVDASSVPSIRKALSNDALIVAEKNESHRKSKPSKRPKTEVPSLENGSALQQAAIARPDPRHVKGRRGHLKQMVEMPLDTLHDIFRELEPIDLLHLSWASKSLHAILVEKASRYIWEEAFERLYGSDNPPPRCPEDLNLAQYTRFLFEKKCFVCNVTDGYWCSWMMRLRACKKCLYESGEFIPRYECDIRSEPYLLAIRANKIDFYSKAEYLKMKNAYDHNGWRIKTARTKQITAFEQWESNRLNDWKDDLNQRRTERKTAIVEKLKEIGWKESEILAVVDSCATDTLPGFTRAKKLTNSDWKDLQPKLANRLEVVKDAELVRVRGIKLRNRWRAFCDQIECWKKSQTIESFWVPHVVDLAVCEPFRSIIFTPSFEDGDFPIDEIDHAAREWMESRDNLILSVLPKEVQATLTCEHGPDTEDKPLRKLLFASLFLHGGSPSGSDTIDRVCSYRFGMTDSSRITKDGRMRDELKRCGVWERPWDWDCYDLKFDSQKHEIAKEVITLFGMDPQTATISEMWQCEQRFECVRCSDIYSTWNGGKRDWYHVISHETWHRRERNEQSESLLAERWS